MQGMEGQFFFFSALKITLSIQLHCVTGREILDYVITNLFVLQLLLFLLPVNGGTIFVQIIGV